MCAPEPFCQLRLVSIHVQDRRSKIQNDIAFHKGLLAELQSELEWLGVDAGSDAGPALSADAVAEPSRHVRKRQELPESTDESHGEDCRDEAISHKSSRF